ncbi:MAG: peptidoglycan D,D-transpeptidase FtsI family protein [Alphaproteobacteria bacterium]
MTHNPFKPVADFFTLSSDQQDQDQGPDQARQSEYGDFAAENGAASALYFADLADEDSRIGDKKNALSSHHIQARARAFMVAFVMFIAFAFIAHGIVKTSHLRPEDYGIRAEQPLPTIKERPRISKRADILDRNGMMLASNLETRDLYYQEQPLYSAEYVASHLAEILNMDIENKADKIDPNALYERIKDRKSRFRLFTKIAPSLYQRIHGLGFPHLTWEKSESRALTQPITSHVVGYPGFADVVRDGKTINVHKGLMGAERAFETRLTAHPDQPLILSIDTRLQAKSHQILGTYIDKFSALAGGVLVMNIKTGEILTNISLPDFDPDRPLSPDHPAQRNVMVDDALELGSVLKIINTALYLDRGNGALTDIHDATNPLRLGRNYIRDFHPKKRPLNVAETFVFSSNIASALMADKVGAAAQKDFFNAIHLTDCAPSEIGNCKQANYLSPWNRTRAYSIAYGHGFATSPMALAASIGGLIGTKGYTQPTLLKQSAEDFENKKFEPLISAESQTQIRQLMRLNMIYGSGKKAEIPGYYIGGKTGTASKLNADGKYGNKNRNSFIAAFPMDDPQYLVYGLIDEPKGIKETHGFATSGWTAAPLVKEIINAMIGLYAIAPYHPIGSDPDDFDPLMTKAIHIALDGHGG